MFLLSKSVINDGLVPDNHLFLLVFDVRSFSSIHDSIDMEA
jgi:hypothetical protein